MLYDYFVNYVLVNVGAFMLISMVLMVVTILFTVIYYDISKYNGKKSNFRFVLILMCVFFTFAATIINLGPDRSFYIFHYGDPRATK